MQASRVVETLDLFEQAPARLETCDYAGQFGLVARFTPVCSPENNGTSKAFVKTLKRDCFDHFLGVVAGGTERRCAPYRSTCRDLPA